MRYQTVFKHLPWASSSNERARAAHAAAYTCHTASTHQCRTAGLQTSTLELQHYPLPILMQGSLMQAQRTLRLEPAPPNGHARRGPATAAPPGSPAVAVPAP